MPQYSPYKFRGGMDLDSLPANIAQGFLSDSRNVEFVGLPGDMIPRGLPGTTLIWNSMPAGNNLCIGKYYDKVNNQVFWFNWNSNATHGIYIYNLSAQAVQTLIINGSTTDGDILGFTQYGVITSIDITYGDPDTGDLFSWVDSLGRPSEINVQQYLGLLAANPSYPQLNALIKRNYIDVAKAPPRMSPKCCYINDTSVTANQVNKNLFQFRARYTYDNFNKSVYGQPGQVPLPFQSSTQLTPFPVTSNSAIVVYFPTGDVDVKQIELWVKITSDSNLPQPNAETPDWQLIYSFNKANLAIPSNSVYSYTFYNNTVLTTGSIDEEDQIYDDVPLKTLCGKVLNGNVKAYAGITEGYPNTIINAFNTTTLANTTVNNAPGMVFFGVQGSYDSAGTGNLLTLYLNGAGATPNSIPYTNVVLTVDAADLIGNSLKFTYTAPGTTTAIPIILAGLQTAAIAQGFTFVSSTSNSITLQFSSGYILYSQTYVVPISQLNNISFFSYPYNLHNVDAIVYFDDKGRTMPGATIFLNNGFNTGVDLSGNNVPQNVLTINSAPPIGAKYYTIARGSNSPKQLFWVCNQTFVNTDLDTGQQYVYIGISNMAVYDNEIEASTPVVKYDFSPGDRIQFIARFPVGYPTNPASQLSITNDYPITSVEDDPIINGVIQQGSFIKFPFPTNDINSNFDFSGDNFQNYWIRIYSLFNQAPAANQIYYEYGRLFAIGNYGLSNPYHIGNLQTQLPDLSQPAQIIDSEGDYFKRQRIVPSGNIYYITVLPFESDTNTSPESVLIVPTEIANAPIDNSAYQIANQVLTNIGLGTTGWPPFTSTNQIFWNKTSTAITLRLKGSFTFWTSKSGTLSVFMPIVNAAGPVLVPNNVLSNFTFAETTGGAYQSYTLNIDAEISIPPNCKAWLAYFFKATSSTYTESYSGWNLFFQIVNPITIPIIESSFSDQISLITNSNGRPFLYDPNAQQVFYGVRLRYGQAYQRGTAINNSNRFYSENYAEYTAEYGPIQRMLTPHRNLIIFQSKKIGEVGVYAKFIKNNNGETQLVVSDDIITADNFNYYSGDYGIGNQQDCIDTFDYAIYGVDPYKGIIWRLSQDGLIPISQKYRVQSWAGSNLIPFTSSTTNRLIGCWWLKPAASYSEFILVAQGTDTIRFDETNNQFAGFADIQPDNLICAGNILLGWKNGALYAFNNTSPGNYTSFFGVNYNPSVTMVFNDRTEIKKTFQTLQYDSYVLWQALNVGDIYTSFINPGTGLQQISQLITPDFQVMEGKTYAAFLRDANSGTDPILALLRGDYLKGNWIAVKLTYIGNNYADLHNAICGWDVSPRNF